MSKIREVEAEKRSSKAPKKSDGLALTEKVAERRLVQFQLRLSGVPRREIISQLAPRYEVSPATIDWDWKPAIRRTWILEAIQNTNAKALLAIIDGTDEAVQDACRKTLYELDKLLDDYRNDGKLDLSPNSPVWGLLTLKEKVLRLLMEGNKMRLNNLLRMGILPDLTRKGQISTKENSPEEMIDLDEVLTGFDEESKKRFLESLEKAFERESEL